MPSVTLEVGALVIVLVERDAQPVVVKVDRPAQVLDFEEDLFDTNESHGLPPPSVQNGELLELLHRLMPFCRAGWPALSHGPLISAACSRQNQARVSRSGRQLPGRTPICRSRCALSK